MWAFPAGLIDADDSSFEQAAARELKEETGYDIVRVDDVLRATYTLTRDDEQKLLRLCI